MSAFVCFLDGWAKDKENWFDFQSDLL